MNLLPLIVNGLGGIRATIFAVLCVALGATLWLQSTRLHQAQSVVDADKVTITNFGTAQTSHLNTIAELHKQNADWSSKCRVDPASTAQASQDTEQEHGALPADDQRRADDRSKLYGHDQGAKSWGAVRVPDDIAARLRR